MDRQQAIALLSWYLEMDVDEAVADEPVDRFVERKPAVRPLQHRETRRPAARVTSQRRDTGATAQQRAASASTLEELIQAINNFDDCTLKKTATTTCVADGNPRSRIMLVGEAPGANEDRQGKPFVGPAGVLLDRMLAAIGLDRTCVYITNTIFWRPPGNRTPTPAELSQCVPFVKRQIELVEPALLIFAGATASRQLLGATEGITRIRGRWFRFEQPGKDAIPTLPTFHPAYLLRYPERKRESWRDLLAIRKRMDELGLAGATPVK